MEMIGERKPTSRLLMGPGPSTVDPRVLRALSEPTLGHLDPEFLRIMNETMALLRYVFETENHLTMAMSGTGSAAMETPFVNLLEPGDRAIVCVKGVFGQRMADVVDRCGARLIEVSAPMGQAVDPARVEEAFKRAGGPVKLLGIVHAETSTGVLQPLEDVVRITHEHGALIVVDTVTSLGGVPVGTDRRGLDFVYSGTQKALSCPPGLGPITASETIAKLIRDRKTKVQSWYLDLSMIQRYWGQERFYHHTAPVNMIYALHEALRIIQEEGLEARFARHQRCADSLAAGLRAMGLSLVVKEEHRLPTLTTVFVPEGVNDAAVRSRLLADYNIEIGGGLGDFKGRVLRIGLMGYGAIERNVIFLLTALEEVLTSLGHKAERGAGPAAAAAAATAAANRR
jgi:alanine-glyoxylate transaminase/serine-glyoxylate transaminase/serine-pyruvate transaminase